MRSFHEPEDLGVAPVAVLDGGDPGRGRPTHPLGGRGVRRDGSSERSGGLDDQPQLVDREGGPPGVVGVDLDEVGASTDLVADDLAQAFAVGLLGSLGDRQLGGESARGVGPGGDDRPGGHQEPRPRHDPLLDRLLQPDVGVTCPLGPEVSERGEAGHQVELEVVRRPADPQGQRLQEHLVFPGGLVVGVQQQVRMRIDQARQERATGQIDRPGPLGDLDRGLRADPADRAVADQDDPAVMGLGGRPVEHPGGLEQHGLGQDRRVRGGPSDQDQGRDDESANRHVRDHHFAGSPGFLRNGLGLISTFLIDWR